MLDSVNREDFYQPLRREHVDWLKREGVSTRTLLYPSPLFFVTGRRSRSGWIEVDAEGGEWICDEQDYRLACFDRAGTIAVDPGTFAFGEAAIWDAATYFADFGLAIFASPLDWLRSGRLFGICVVEWAQAFEQLRQCPAIALDPSLVATYRHAMRPKLPRLVPLTKYSPRGRQR